VCGGFLYLFFCFTLRLVLMKVKCFFTAQIPAKVIQQYKKRKRPDEPVSSPPALSSAMMFLVLASALLVTVYGQAPDPTKVCLPDVLQLNLASLTQNASAVVAYDFPKNVFAIRYNQGIHAVVNGADGTIARINQTDSSCVRVTSPSSFKDLYSQCLPARARLVTPPGTFFGLSPERLDIQGWSYDVESVGTVSVGVTTGSPSVPVIRNIISSVGRSDIQLLVNAKTTIDDATIFDVPDDCPAQAVVG
jgi:hypothetical protein